MTRGRMRLSVRSHTSSDNDKTADVAVDIGASEHVRSDLQFIRNVERIPAINVELANGTNVQNIK